MMKEKYRHSIKPKLIHGKRGSSCEVSRVFGRKEPRIVRSREEKIDEKILEPVFAYTLRITEK